MSAPAEGPEDPLVGVVLEERFEVAGFLGKGGMAVVYKAHDRTGPEPVAVKFLPPEFAQKEEFVQRFRRESEAMLELRHPNVVRIHAAGSHEGRAYYVMDYLPHPDLEQVLKGAGALPREEALQIALGIGRALGYVHERGLIHRDLKPANIMVKPGPRAILMDFGLVLDQSRTHLTATGTVVGTPIYMPPEVLKGLPATPTSDLYQLGTILYEMLTGQRAHSGKDMMEIASRAIGGEIVPVEERVPGLPAPWIHLVRNLLAPDPEVRYPLAADFLADGEAVLRGEAVELRASAADAGVTDAFPMAPAGLPGTGGAPTPAPGSFGPRPGTPDPAASLAFQRSPSMALSSSGIRPPEPDAWKRKAAISLVILLGFVGALLWSGGDHRPVEVRLEPSVRSLKVRWRTPDACLGVVEIRPAAGGDWRRFEEGPEATEVHVLEAHELPAGETLQVRFVLPSGETTPSREVELPRFEIDGLRATREGKRGVRLAFTTSLEATCVLVAGDSDAPLEVPVETTDGESHRVLLPGGLGEDFRRPRLVAELPTGELFEASLVEALARHVRRLRDRASAIDVAQISTEVKVTDDSVKDALDKAASFARRSGLAGGSSEAEKLQKKYRNKARRELLGQRLETALAGNDAWEAARELFLFLPWALADPAIDVAARARTYEGIDRVFRLAWWADREDLYHVRKDFPGDLGPFTERARSAIGADARVFDITDAAGVAFGSVSFEDRSVESATFALPLTDPPGSGVAELQVEVDRTLKDHVGLAFTLNEQVTLFVYGTRREHGRGERFFHAFPAALLKQGENRIKVSQTRALDTYSIRSIMVKSLALRLPPGGGG